MRRCHLLVLVSLGVGLAACAPPTPRTNVTHVAQGQPVVLAQGQPVVKSELDAMVYGAPPPNAKSVARGAPVYAAPAPAARGYVAQCASGVCDAPRLSAVPAFAPIEPNTYLLDSGDRLRIVVFGQDTLSNTYTVDAAGLVTMPLIGPVRARG